jgi:competence protein ComEC
LFVGPSASVLRAFIAIQLALSAKLCEKPSSGINALGVGLFVISLYDPLMLLSPSFQLSFLATWAILILYPIVQKKLFALFPKYQGEDLLAFSFVEQFLFMLSTFFVTSLSLVLAVSILMLPMSLFTFGSFPLLGILYNCFFPFCVSVSVTLLLLGVLFCWIPFIASLFFFLSAALIELALTLVQQAPSWIDITLYSNGFSATLLVAYITLVSLCAVLYSYQMKCRN